MHVHVSSQDGTAKFWIDPLIILDHHYNMSLSELQELKEIVEEKRNDFIEQWNKHFRS
ncbi:MAG: DUF4160 domain-containing protein [Bacteroidetes bacterium]|nr:DUF4160 domain-containing protein [Bacteroidota bacterium]